MIYVVRHGETDWNIEGRIQGQHETFLTPNGIKQAEGLHKLLKHIKFDAVFCSPLARAKDTCRIILGGHDESVVYDNALLERDFGEMVGKVDDFMSFWHLGKPRVAKGVESIKEMEQRIFPLMEKLVKEYHDKKVLLVCHQGPLFIMENFFGNASKDGDYKPLQVHGCGYRVYDGKTKQRIKESGLIENDRESLGG